MKWAYGVTTVPMRKDDLLPRTLRSLAKAGFDQPRLFIDGATDRGESWEKYGLEVTVRSPQIRTFGNWILGLAELYIREPTADRYAMFQDDFVTYLNLRDYLESCSYPQHGYWNLYTFPSNQQLAGGRLGWYESNQLGKGAVALIFDRETVVTLLSSTEIAVRPQDPHRGWKAIDGGIVTALRKAGWKEYVHNPSLVQHTGTVSSMRNRPHLQAESFRGEGYDARQMTGYTKTWEERQFDWAKEAEACRKAVEDDRRRLEFETDESRRQHYRQLIDEYTVKLRHALRMAAVTEGR